MSEGKQLNPWAPTEAHSSAELDRARKKLNRPAEQMKKKKHALQRKLERQARRKKKGRNFPPVRNKTINLENLQLTDADLAALVEEFEEVFVLSESIKLNKNNLGNKALEALAKVLTVSVVTKLDLRENKIGNAGARLLASIFNDSILEEIMLDKNNIGDDGVKALADNIVHGRRLKKVSMSGNQHSKAVKKALAKSLKAKKLIKSEDDVVDEAKANQSTAPPPPSETGDARVLEKKANSLLDRLRGAATGGCSGGDYDSALVAKFESMTNYSTVIPMLRDTDAADLLFPLASGEVKGRSPSDQVRAAMAVANLIGDTSAGSERLREAGVVALLLAQFASTVSKQEYEGVKWDLGHTVVPLLALSTEKTNTDSLESSKDMILEAGSKLLEDDRPGDVERAVSVLGHLSRNGVSPTSKVDTNILLRNVRDRAERKRATLTNIKESIGPYQNAGFEAAALMSAIETDTMSLKANPKTKFDAMISYSWAQKPVAKHLLIQLQRRGLIVFFDEHFLAANIYQKMADGVMGATTIIICASHEYRLSPNCQREASFAADQKKKIIPVIVQPNYRPQDWLAFVVAGLLYYDLSTHDGREFSAAVDEIVSKEGLK